MVAILKGATSISVYLEVLDSASTTGGRKTGIAFNAAGLTAYYSRNQAAAVAITLVTQTAAGAYSSGGWVEVDATNMPGVYRLDVPNAAIASGVDSVVVTVKGAAGMVQVSKEIQLTSVNLQDAVRLGMTALPNANAEAAGGLYTRGAGAGQINQPANGRVDTNVVAVAGTTQTARDLGANLDVVVSTRATPAQILVTPANLLATDASGRVTVGSIVNGAIAAATFAANALDAVWTAATRTLSAFGFSVTVGTNNDKTGYTASTVSDKTGYSLAVAPPTAAAISTQVWTEPVPGAFAAGSAGAKLNSASAAGDPWGTAVPGAYAAGTAGNILGNRLDVAVSTRATSAGAGGAGSRSVTITVYKPGGTIPLGSCAVWVSTDLAGTNVVAGTLYTNDSTGQVTFMLDNGNYYYWRQHPAYTFTNPQAITVS